MINSDPSLLISYDSMSSVEFTGTFYVATTKDDDYIGFVFNYQSNRKFMLVSWKQRTQRYGFRGPTGRAGLQIHVVSSTTGPSRELIRALWYSGTTKNQVNRNKSTSYNSTSIPTSMHEFNSYIRTFPIRFFQRSFPSLFSILLVR